MQTNSLQSNLITHSDGDRIHCCRDRCIDSSFNNDGRWIRPTRTASTCFEFSSTSSRSINVSRVQAHRHESCPNKSLPSPRPTTNRKEYFIAIEPVSYGDDETFHGKS